MSLFMKIALGIGAVILIIGSTLVTIAALFPPKEWKGERIDRLTPDEQRKYQEEMYRRHQMG